jgi:hypothetical protein
MVGYDEQGKILKETAMEYITVPSLHSSEEGGLRKIMKPHSDS